MTGSGWVAWPDADPTWKDTGEGGMWVYAFVLAAGDGDPGSDAFVRCHGPAETICLPMPDVVVSDTEPAVYPTGHSARVLETPPGEDRVIGVFDAGYSVLAAVCLGSSSVPYGNHEIGHWQCRDTDLTHEGRILLAHLRQLYGRNPVLVTYLDT